MRRSTLNYISLIAIFIAIVIIGMSIASQSSQHYSPVFKSLSEFTPPKFWGRASFVPDWHAGEEADVKASMEFLEKWSMKLHELPNIKRQLPPTKSTPSVSVRAVPHWREIRPFEAIDTLEDENFHVGKFAARGESEVFAFAVRSEQTELEISASLEDWFVDGQASSGIPASIRLMLPYLAREQAGKRASDLVVKPMLLLADVENTWAFPASYTMVLCADFHIGVDTKPGLYNANFTLRSGGKIVSQTAIQLRVLPFQLLVNNFHAGAFRVTYDLWAGGFTGYYPEMVDMDSRYGFNIAGGFFNKANEIPFSRDPLGRIIVNRSDPAFKTFDRKMRMLARHGMGDVLFWNWGGSGKYNQFINVLKAAGLSEPFDSDIGKQEFAQILRAIKDVELRMRWPEIVINPYDEALKDQDATKRIIEAIPYVRKTSPKTRLYMTEWRKGYTRHYQSSGQQLQGKERPRKKEYQKLLSNNESLRANFDVIGSNIMDAAGRAIQDSVGGEYWHYGGASRHAAATQFGLGFQPWATRAESVLVWANYKGSLLNEGWTVHYVLPRDANGRKNRNTRGPVLASSRAYVVREGIDDRKYIETLRYHAWRTGSQEDWQYLASLSKRVKQLLLNKHDIGGINNVDGELARHANLYQLRAALKDRILKLHTRPSIH